jgi:hypothetical protein
LCRFFSSLYRAPCALRHLKHFTWTFKITG